MMIARHGSAWHVETLVRKYRWVKRLEAEEETDDLHALRSLDYYYDGDGMLVIRGRLPTEQGALFVKAIEAAMDAAEAESPESEGSETQETAESQDLNTESTRTTATSVPAHARRADALVELAECRLSGNRGSSTADARALVRESHLRQESLIRQFRNRESTGAVLLREERLADRLDRHPWIHGDRRPLMWSAPAKRSDEGAFTLR